MWVCHWNASLSIADLLADDIFMLADDVKKIYPRLDLECLSTFLDLVCKKTAPLNVFKSDNRAVGHHRSPLFF